VTQAIGPTDPTTARAALPRDPRRGVVSAGECYWAVLDPRPLGRRRIAPAERGYLFESFLPVSIEEVQASYLPLADGRVIACGFERARLDAMTRDGLLSLSPDLVPDFVLREARCAVEPMGFDFLDGDFEPVEVRRVRRHRFAAAAVLLLAIGAVAAVGVWRRGDAYSRAVETVDERRSELLRAAYRGEGGGARADSGLPLDLKLVAELRRLRQTRASDAPVLLDAAPVLAAVVAAWPADAEARCDGVAVRDGAVVLRGVAKDADAVARVEDAYRAIPGWTIDGGAQFNATERGASFTLTLRPDSGALAPRRSGGSAGGGA
jgi:hypothetical protein